MATFSGLLAREQGTAGRKQRENGKGVCWGGLHALGGWARALLKICKGEIEPIVKFGIQQRQEQRSRSGQQGGPEASA